MATPNPFDQFDVPAAASGGNPFDRFDPEPPSTPVLGRTFSTGSAAARQGFGRGGRAPTQETLNAMLDNPVARFGDAAQDVGQGVIDDPVGVAAALPAAINRGVIVGLGQVADAPANAADILGMLYGVTRGAISGRPADEFYKPINRGGEGAMGFGENFVNLIDRGTTAIGAGSGIQNPRPNNPAARLVYNIAQNIPGAMTGRQLVSSLAGGAAQTAIAQAGGDPAMQAVAGLLGGRVAERPAAPGRTPQVEPTSSFGRDSASAAAATPELINVPQELRTPLVKAFQRGDRELVQRVVEGETLPVPVRLTEGQARQDPLMISDELNYRGTDASMANHLKEQNQALIDNLDTVRREVAPNVVANDHIQNGQALIDAYKAYDEPLRADITAKYKALEDANGGQLPINGQAFVNAADAALAKKLKTRYLPSAVKGDLEQFREAGGMMTFEQFENLRTNLATEARRAERAGDGNAAAAINVVRRELENMPMEGLPTELKAMADEARAAARARFEALDADPAYRAAVDDDTPTGELSAFADDFVKKFVVNGKAANLTRMQAKLSADPLAAETIAAAALNYVKSKSGVNLYTNEGNFSQAGFNRALAEITPRLESLVPAHVAEVLQRLGNVARYAQARPKGSLVNESNTFTAAARDAAKGYAEGTLNAVVPGAQLGSFVRKRRSDARDRKRVERALDPRRYLIEESE